MMRSYCSQSSSKGIIVSHLQAVVPYGKSQMMQSTEPSGMRFIPSKQSSLYILFSSIIFIKTNFPVSGFDCYLFLLLRGIRGGIVLLVVRNRWCLSRSQRSRSPSCRRYAAAAATEVSIKDFTPPLRKSLIYRHIALRASVWGVSSVRDPTWVW